MPMSVVYTTVNGPLVEENRNWVVIWYIPDTLGNVIKTADVNGNITSETTYWPFGEVRTQVGTNPSPWGFCGIWGYLQDAAARLYVRARYLRADLGRWMTVDPLWPGEPAYGYVSNNPAIQVDLAGYAALPSLTECKSRSRGACFHCAYRIFSERKYCPKQACEAANRLCGSHVQCGPCGMCPMAKVPGRCDRLALDELGIFLRGTKSRTGAPFDCSAACGGYGGADKLAHCLAGCVMFICIGHPCGMIGIYDDEEDNLAEWTGYYIAFDHRLRSKAVGDGFAERLEQCAEATGGLTCY